jgi:3'-phosphoadenosine 5'-phosphosulfate sulfotransferase (PAPS reductase)/FAD synthetase
MSSENQVYRKVYAAHYQAVIAGAHRIVAKAVAAYPGPVAVAVSGGKDSVAMAHIVAQHCNPSVLWNDSGLELPESEGVVRSLATMIGARVIVATGDALGIKMAKGREGAERTAKHTDQQAIIEPVRKAIAEHGIVLEFVGLRKTECRNRRIMLCKYGPIHENKRWGCVTAWPMMDWEGADCLAYIEEHELPLHPAYLRTPWERRHEARVSWVWDSTREKMGELELMRRWYPALYQRLREAGINGF